MIPKTQVCVSSAHDSLQSNVVKHYCEETLLWAKPIAPLPYLLEDFLFSFVSEMKNLVALCLVGFEMGPILFLKVSNNDWMTKSFQNALLFGCILVPNSPMQMIHHSRRFNTTALMRIHMTRIVLLLDTVLIYSFFGMKIRNWNTTNADIWTIATPFHILQLYIILV